MVDFSVGAQSIWLFMHHSEHGKKDGVRKFTEKYKEQLQSEKKIWYRNDKKSQVVSVLWNSKPYYLYKWMSNNLCISKGCIMPQYFLSNILWDHDETFAFTHLLVPKLFNSLSLHCFTLESLEGDSGFHSAFHHLLKQMWP